MWTQNCSRRPIKLARMVSPVLVSRAPPGDNPEICIKGFIEKANENDG
jgi:hypothetical protein